VKSSVGGFSDFSDERDREILVEWVVGDIEWGFGEDIWTGIFGYDLSWRAWLSPRVASRRSRRVRAAFRKLEFYCFRLRSFEVGRSRSCRGPLLSVVHLLLMRVAQGRRRSRYNKPRYRTFRTGGSGILFR